MTGQEASRELTARERRVVDELRQIARHWPKSIMLVSMDGGLQVVDKAAYHAGNDASFNGAERQDACVLANIRDIPTDGGGW